MSRYVGIDLHRRRSVVVILDPDGTKVSSERIDNSPLELVRAVAEAGPAPEVVLEATWRWYWAADVLGEAGGRVHLGASAGCEGIREPSGEERRKGRHLVGRPVADGESARELDCTQVTAGVAGAGPVSPQTVPAPHRVEVPGAFGWEG